MAYISSGVIAVLAAQEAVRRRKQLATQIGPTISLVEQINKILHENYIGTPLEKHYIRLIEDPSAGVIVKVDNDTFNGVDAVTNPEIRAAIKAAVTQWEKAH